MRLYFLFAIGVSAGPAMADPGHLADLAGHGHWAGAAAAGLAVLVGVWGALKGGKNAGSDAETSDETEPQEA